MIKTKIQQNLFISLKERKSEETNIWRLILSQIKNKEIDKKKELTDEEIIQLIKKMIKDLQEAILMFKKGGRQDLIEKNQLQIKTLSALLPQEVSDEELKDEIKKIIKNNQQLAENNSKALIGICVKSLKAKADARRIISVLNQLLTH